VRVLDSPTLEPDDPIAFVREPAIHWIVALQVVETVEGDPIGPRLGVIVHSPSMFASATWGLGASPQQDPATLELKWSPEYCLFELTRSTRPTAPARASDDPSPFKVPAVHSTILR
jgi:hypothetical protein